MDGALEKRLNELALRARHSGLACFTRFLEPSTLAAVNATAGRVGVKVALWGGYEGAERSLILFLPDWLEAEDAPSQSPIRCLRAVFRPEEKLTHRDFLGSLMGMGIVREKIGDILVGPDSADLLVLDTVADFLRQSWDSAGRAKLTVTEIDPGHIHIPEVKCQEVRDTVSSLRLDAVASTGFRMARGKAAELISGGRVQVNWRECTKPDKLLGAGDTVSARGFGKFVLAEVGGTTRKGRISIVVKRYV